MLLTRCLATALVCYLATADDITSSRNDSDSGLKRTLEELEEVDIQASQHHIVKRSLKYGTHFIGVGYNYLKGNPDGGKSSHGGIDPGIKTTRRHLKLSATKCSDEDPPEIADATQSSCVEHSTNMVFHGTKSYQSNLKIDAEVAVEGSYGLADFAFSMSSMYEQAQEETINTQSVVLDVHKVCNRGRMRVKKELAQAQGSFSVDEAFAAAVCALPTTYNESVYMQFVEDWGTHTIFETELGTKTVERSKSTLKELFKYAMTNVAASVSASGGYAGYSGSLDLNLDTLSSSSSFSSNFQESLYSFTLGSDTHPEPIGYKLEAMPVMLEATYWSNLGSFVTKGLCPSGSTHANRIAVIRTNVETALRGYPAYLQAPAPQDLTLKIPIVWPFGTYAIVMARTGCPTGRGGTLFHSGWRYHDTEDENPGNYWSDSIGRLYVKGDYHRSALKWNFCSKIVESFTDYDIPWPQGEYCILKKGASCPAGFTQGCLKWDDEDSNNANNYGGTMPEGNYGRDTEIYFCCRSDGHAENPIFLPVDKPFVLMMEADTCQQVYGMNVKKLYLRFDDEDDNNADYRVGDYPYDDGGSKDHRLWYCHYSKK